MNRLPSRTPLKRSPLARKPGQGLKRTPLPKVNRVRRAEAFARAYGGRERVEWVQAQPCAVCHATPSENAHIRSGGMGYKAPASFVAPLCREHHREQHAVGLRAFEDRYRVNLGRVATAIERRWQEHRSAA
jgi:hypothetical protein